jgi:hypothetical protein
MKIIELTYFGKVDCNGKLSISDRKGFEKYLLQFTDQTVTIDVKRKRAKRSLSQNAFFHSWCTLLAEHLGYSLDEMKEIIKFKFLKVEEINDMTGEIVTYTRKTSELNKMQFADFCTEVQQWTENKLGMRLPLPNENWEIKYV